MLFVRILFPKELRSFPYRRHIRIALRTLHILSGGVLLGGHVFNQPVEALQLWLIATVVSGLLLLLTDLYASATILFELRGVVGILKISLLLLVPVFWPQRVFILMLVLIIGAISSHMTGRLRHRRVLFSRCRAIDYSKS